ncbi:MAG: acetyl-CoA carboxylase carboxyltransferase subunit alpha [Thermoleophilia bacterium]|nr:acetyl-CoA carboxylase carboxyltransferase subunit alpha [Thermoleophilia bacterium]
MSSELTAAPRAAGPVEWTKCPSCDAFVYHKRLRRNLGVCPECNYHFRLPVQRRLEQLLDDDSFTDLSDEIQPLDVLSFADTKPYADRLADAQRKTGGREAAVYGTAEIDGHPVVVAAMDFAFVGGSMGSGVGEAVTRAAELALERRTPLLVIATSGGARMQEGCVSLMQMAKTSQAVARLHEEGILFVSLLTDPTYGGVTASFPTLGDILLSEPNSYIGFAGPKVIEQTIRQTLPEGFQTAEFLLDHGMLDLVEPRENLRQALRKLLELHSLAPVAGQPRKEIVARLPETEGRAPVTDPALLPARPAWDVVQLARHIDRPNTLEYVGYVFDDFQELAGDRLFDEDAAIVGGLARLGDLTVVLIGHQKGHTTSEMVERNFGMPNPEGYRKGMRLMRHAAKFGLPIVTLVDTPGAYPGLGAEERGQSIAIAQSIMEMSRLPVPTVTAVTGEGGSGGALALAVGDRVLMMENSYYSVISPEGCSTILFKDASQAPRAAEALRVTAPDLLRLGIMDAVVPEPEGGAHHDPADAAANLKTAIVTALRDLLPTPVDELLQRRYDRFRAFGTPGRQPVLPPPAEVP